MGVQWPTRVSLRFYDMRGLTTTCLLFRALASFPAPQPGTGAAGPFAVLEGSHDY